VTSPGLRASGISPDGQFTTVISDGKLSLHSLTGTRDISLGAVEPNVSIIRFSNDGR
jgi:hypothetical protein